MFCCEFCNKKYKYNSGLSRHMNAVHQNEMDEINKQEEIETTTDIEIVQKQDNNGRGKRIT